MSTQSNERPGLDFYVSVCKLKVFMDICLSFYLSPFLYFLIYLLHDEDLLLYLFSSNNTE